MKGVTVVKTTSVGARVEVLRPKRDGTVQRNDGSGGGGFGEDVNVDISGSAAAANSETRLYGRDGVVEKGSVLEAKTAGSPISNSAIYEMVVGRIDDSSLNYGQKVELRKVAEEHFKKAESMSEQYEVANLVSAMLGKMLGAAYKEAS